MATELCVGHDAGTQSEIHAKTDQHCRAEDCLAIDMSVYMSVTERHKCIFYIATVARVDTPYMEKSGNLIMTGEWPL